MTDFDRRLPLYILAWFLLTAALSAAVFYGG